jgi:hypothetical protein
MPIYLLDSNMFCHTEIEHVRPALVNLVCWIGASVKVLMSPAAAVAVSTRVTVTEFEASHAGMVESFLTRY